MTPPHHKHLVTYFSFIEKKIIRILFHLLYCLLRQTTVVMETWRFYGNKWRDLLFVNYDHYLIKLRSCLPTWNKRKYFGCSFLSLEQTDQTLSVTGTLLPFIQQQLSHSFIKLSFLLWYWFLVWLCDIPILLQYESSN